MFLQIDHFGFDENGTFQQRYLVADQHWKKDNGPILFYTGNEGDIEWFCSNTVGGKQWDCSPACQSWHPEKVRRSKKTVTEGR